MTPRQAARRAREDRTVGHTARLATAGVLAVLAIAILAVPHELPGFVVPGSSGSMHAMNAMG